MNRTKYQVGSWSHSDHGSEIKQQQCQAHGKGYYFFQHDRPYADAIKARISSTRQTVTRGPSFTGLGNRPDLTPCHQQDFLTGIIGGIGGFALAYEALVLLQYANHLATGAALTEDGRNRLLLSAKRINSAHGATI